MLSLVQDMLDDLQHAMESAQENPKTSECEHGRTVCMLQKFIKLSKVVEGIHEQGLRETTNAICCDGNELRYAQIHRFDYFSHFSCE